MVDIPQRNPKRVAPAAPVIKPGGVPVVASTPERNPIRSGPTYKPGESLLGTVGRVVSQDLPNLAGRISRAWTASTRPATAGPPKPATAEPQGTQPAPTPEMLKARQSIADIESRGSGGYEAIGPKTKTGDRAHGRYQVMGANIPKWTKEVTGREHTPDEFRKDQGLQDKVFDKQFGDAAKKYGYEGASKWWFTGKPPSKITGKEKDVVGTSASQYGAKFTAGFGEEKIPDKEFSNWWKQGYKSYTNASKKKPLKDKEVKEENLDEFKSPWANVVKAAADTDRWRQNRTERKLDTKDPKPEKKSGWLRGAVKDYMSAKYGVKEDSNPYREDAHGDLVDKHVNLLKNKGHKVTGTVRHDDGEGPMRTTIHYKNKEGKDFSKSVSGGKWKHMKEEKLDEIAPAIEVVGWRKQFQDKDKAKAEAKAKAKKAFAAPNPAKGERFPRRGRIPPLKEGAIANKIADVMDKHKLWGKVPFTKKLEYDDDYEPKKKPHTSTIKGKKYVVKEAGTQTSPGVESEEHPKKFELPEKYEGAYSVRSIYKEGSGSFYGGAGQGGGAGVAGPSARQAPRPAARPQVARPQAAAAPVAKPAAPAPAATPAAAPVSAPVNKPSTGPVAPGTGTSPVAAPTGAPTPFSPKAEPVGGTSVPERFRMAGSDTTPPKPAAPTSAAIPTPAPNATGDTAQSQPTMGKPKSKVLDIFKQFVPSIGG